MSKIKVKNLENNKVAIYTPYNKKFVAEIKNIGGAKWNGEAWIIPEAGLEYARDIMFDIYGETDIDVENDVILGKNNTETINHSVTKLKFLQEIMSHKNKQLEIEDISNEYNNVLSELEIKYKISNNH